MASEETAKAVTSLLGTVTSPAKIVLVGFVVLVAMGKICVTLGEFLWVSALCFVAQFVHDDWLRIVLNRFAEEKWPKK
jgi:hypothetical protein